MNFKITFEKEMGTKEELAEKLFKHYKKSDSGGYILNFKIPELDELFDRHDPSPIHEKDLNPRIMSLILEEIVVFPSNAKLELHFILPKESKQKVNELDLKNAVQHHFEYEYLDSELHLERRIQKGRQTLFYAFGIFILLFTSYYLLSKIDNVILHLLAEGCVVGAWVTMWHPIETLLYDWLPLYEDKKKYERLLETKIVFKYF